MKISELIRADSIRSELEKGKPFPLSGKWAGLTAQRDSSESYPRLVLVRTPDGEAVVRNSTSEREGWDDHRAKELALAVLEAHKWPDHQYFGNLIDRYLEGGKVYKGGSSPTPYPPFAKLVRQTLQVVRRIMGDSKFEQALARYYLPEEEEYTRLMTDSK